MQRANVLNLVWDTSLLDWVRMSQPILNAGSVVVSGAVDQGTGGVSAWLVVESRPATSSVTSVAASAGNVTLLASNPSRRGATFFNDSTSAAYVKFGATASTSSFTVKMFGAGYFEMPTPAYTGIVDALWDTGTGNMRITEMT